MSWLVRKIEKGKWLQNKTEIVDDISADAITNCMKTSKRTLSTWRIKSEEYIDDAVLAMVSGHKHLDTIDVVLIDQEKLVKSGVKIETTPGLTPVSDLVNRHVDIASLTYKSLGIVANEIMISFPKDKVKRYTRKTLKKLLNAAINSGRLSIEDLELSIAKKL